MANFVNLHTHSDFSLHDSIIKCSDLIKTIKEYGQKSVALTDHGLISGWFDFNIECDKNDIKPIFGMEAYCHEHEGMKEKRRDHLIILAKNNNGKILIQKLNHLANKNFYYKPILSYDNLFKYASNDIIISSACSLGSLGYYILNNEVDKAVILAERFKDNFIHYYLELQFHDPEIYPEQMKVNGVLLEISEILNLPLIVTTDAHIMKEEDIETRSMYQSMGWHMKFEDVLKDRPTMKTNSIGNDELIKQFAEESNFSDMGIVKSAIKNTSKIADMCNANWDEYEKHIPDFNYHQELKNMLSIKTKAVSLGDF